MDLKIMHMAQYSPILATPLREAINTCYHAHKQRSLSHSPRSHLALGPVMSTETLGVSKGVALVTGSGQGIGRSIALRLANDGYDIGLNDLHANKDKLEALSKEITQQCPGRRVCVLVADVSVEGEVKDMVDGVVAALGRLDVVSLRMCSD